MAGQGPSRRELLQALGLASAASMFPGFCRWSYALADPASQHAHGVSPQPRVHPVYRPQFFSPTEYATVEILADLILPATPGASRVKTRPGAHTMQPGAKQAGVAEFIDFMVSTDAALQVPFRDGLAWLDHAAAPTASFARLIPAQQNALLERLAYKAKQQDAEKAGQQFFLLMRKYTVTGFYTTRIGLEALDYPGLTFYGASPECTHKGNPEHVGLG